MAYLTAKSQHKKTTPGEDHVHVDGKISMRDKPPRPPRPPHRTDLNTEQNSTM